MTTIGPPPAARSSPVARGAQGLLLAQQLEERQCKETLVELSEFGAGQRFLRRNEWELAEKGW